MSRTMWIAMTDTQSEYLVLEFTYTTAEIEGNRFCGETPDPVYFAMPEPPIEAAPVTLTVIDGQLRVVRDQSPPGAVLPNYASSLFEFAAEPALMI